MNTFTEQDMTSMLEVIFDMAPSEHILANRRMVRLMKRVARGRPLATERAKSARGRKRALSKSRW